MNKLLSIVVPAYIEFLSLGVLEEEQLAK